LENLHLGRGSEHTVTPYRQGGRSVLVASFRDHRKKRVTRSLGTADESTAKQICASIEQLQRGAVTKIDEVPVTIHPKAFQLYFGTESLSELISHFVTTGIETTPRRLEEAAKHAAMPEANSVMLFVKLQETLAELETQKNENLNLRRALEKTTRELASLKNSIVAYAAKKKRPACPTTEDALTEFEKHLKAAVGHPKSFVSVTGCVRRFLEELPEELRLGPVDQITTQVISRYLDQLPGDASRRLSRRQKWRTRLGRFLNWTAKTYEYESPMDGVQKVADSQVDQERGDIVWHSLKEIEAAIERAPDLYWQTVIATFAYSGLRLSELVWLRVQDVNLKDNQIWVTTVEDGEAQHAVKSFHSRRSVRIHARYLKPRIEAYLEAGLPGETFFFPMPEAMRRRTRAKTEGSVERWREDGLSAKIRSVLNSKKTGIKPLTLRHTFGSLLIRSGRNATEVAAAMGNTPDVVARHYARLLGSEVDVDF
jgi:integrase